MAAGCTGPWLGTSQVMGTGAALAACSSRPPDDSADYAQKITAGRAAKDAQFQASNDPVPAAKKVLAKAGAREGDIVWIAEFSFEFVPEV